MFKNLSPGAVGIRCSWLEGLDLAQQAGFEGADLSLGDGKKIADEQGIDAVKELFASRHLKMGGWGLPVNWRGTDAEFYESLSRLPAQAQLAAELGCFRTMTWVPPCSHDKPRKENFDFHVKRFRLIAEVLKDYGHRLGLEFIGPRTSRAAAQHGFIYTMDGMLALCCAIGTGNVGLLLDCWHWYTAQSTLDDLKHLTADDVVYVHLNDAPADRHVLDQIDNQRCLPGETGVIPLREFLSILKGIGFDGPVTVEPFNQRLRNIAEKDALQAARMTKESLDKVWVTEEVSS